MKKLTLIVMALSLMSILMAGCSGSTDSGTGGTDAKTDAPKTDAGK